MNNNNNKHLMNSSHLNQFIAKINIKAFLNTVALKTSAELQCENKKHFNFWILFDKAVYCNSAVI